MKTTHSITVFDYLFLICLYKKRVAKGSPNRKSKIDDRYHSSDNIVDLCCFNYNFTSTND